MNGRDYSSVSTNICMEGSLNKPQPPYDLITNPWNHLETYFILSGIFLCIKHPHEECFCANMDVLYWWVHVNNRLKVDVRGLDFFSS